MNQAIHPYDVGLILGSIGGLSLGYIAHSTGVWGVAPVALVLGLLCWLVVDRLIARVQHGNWLYQPAYGGFPLQPAEDTD